MKIFVICVGIFELVLAVYLFIDSINFGGFNHFGFASGILIAEGFTDIKRGLVEL